MFDIDRFVADCRAALAAATPALAGKEVVGRAMAAPADVERALAALRGAGLKNLYAAPDLTIIHVVWPPGMTVNPHDHRMWAIIGVYTGQEDNAFYRRAPGGLERAGGRSLAVGDTAVLGRDAIHAVVNPL